MLDVMIEKLLNGLDPHYAIVDTLREESTDGEKKSYGRGLKHGIVGGAIVGATAYRMGSKLWRKVYGKPPKRRDGLMRDDFMYGQHEFQPYGGVSHRHPDTSMVYPARFVYHN